MSDLTEAYDGIEDAWLHVLFVDEIGIYVEAPEEHDSPDANGRDVVRVFREEVDCWRYRDIVMGLHPNAVNKLSVKRMTLEFFLENAPKVQWRRPLRVELCRCRAGKDVETIDVLWDPARILH